MQTTATFATAPLADSIQKAAKIAPSKGAAFDKAAGIVVEVSPDADYAVVKATDLDGTYLQHVPMAEPVKGEFKRWRFPASLLASLMTSLPMGAGAVVKVVDKEDAFIRINAGRFNGKLRLIEAVGYPKLDWFDFELSEFGEANEFASKIAQVAWATSKEGGNPLSGVRIDGTRLIACDRYCLAFLPCVVPVERPVIVPLEQMAPLLKSATDVRLRADDQRLMMHLDPETQASSRLIEGSYPDVDRLIRDDFTGSVEFSKSEFTETLNRLLLLVRSENMPTVTITINGSALIKTMVMDVEANGERMQDVIDVSTELGDSAILMVTPSYILNAVGGCRSDKAKLFFGKPDKNPTATVVIKDGAGYECHMVPRVK